MQAIEVLFGHLDPRDQNARHDFCGMLVIAIAAVLCGAKNCSDMWRFAEAKELVLRNVLQLEHGVPSHDTFSALFRKLDPVAFAEAFGRFARQFAAVGGSPGRPRVCDQHALRRRENRDPRRQRRPDVRPEGVSGTGACRCGHPSVQWHLHRRLAGDGAIAVRADAVITA
jgi:hypothetical protein